MVRAFEAVPVMARPAKVPSSDCPNVAPGKPVEAGAALTPAAGESAAASRIAGAALAQLGGTDKPPIDGA